GRLHVSGSLPRRADRGDLRVASSPLLVAAAATGRDRRAQPRRLRLGPKSPRQTASGRPAAVRPDARDQPGAGGATQVNEIEPDAVESALDGLGASWKKREDGWVIPATARTPCEIVIVANSDGLRIEGVLVRWDEAGETELTALAALLKRAES